MGEKGGEFGVVVDEGDVACSTDWRGLAGEGGVVWGYVYMGQPCCPG